MQHVTFTRSHDNIIKAKECILHNSYVTLSHLSFTPQVSHLSSKKEPYMLYVAWATAGQQNQSSNTHLISDTGSISFWREWVGFGYEII